MFAHCLPHVSTKVKHQPGAGANRHDVTTAAEQDEV